MTRVLVGRDDQHRFYLVNPSLQVPHRHGPPEDHSKHESSKGNSTAGKLDDVVCDADLVLGDPIVGQLPDDKFSASVRVPTTPKDVPAEECARHCFTHIPYEPGRG